MLLQKKRLSFSCLLVGIFFFLAFFFSSPKSALAQTCSSQWTINGKEGIEGEGANKVPVNYADKLVLNIKIILEDVTPGHKFTFCTDECRDDLGSRDYIEKRTAQETQETFYLIIPATGNEAHDEGPHHLEVRNVTPGIATYDEPICYFPYEIVKQKSRSGIQEICVDVQENKTACENCFDAGDIWTAIGCIPTSNLNSFVAWLLGRALFIATGIAFLLMVFGAIQILTSAGNPDKVKAGGELITSAIAGLLLIILSAFLLKLIGVDILHIPGF
ncbi:MAG TPA: hypothetical protein VMW25_02895 [Clostridia bacterium]|nr:hypothetical protein [Clostridia bacterium]